MLVRTFFLFAVVFVNACFNSENEIECTWNIDSSKPLSFALMVVGTRGDLDPFLAIGIKLHELGHRVRICSHANYNNTVLSRGLEFYPIEGDPVQLSQFMIKTKGKIIGFDPLKAAVSSEAGRMKRMMEKITFSTWPAVTENDLVSGEPFFVDVIVTNPPVMGHLHIAEKLNVPLHFMFPAPWLETKYFPHTMSGSKYKNYGIPSEYNKLSYKLFEGVIDMNLGPMLNRFRKSLGLVPQSHKRRYDQIQKMPFTCLWSAALIPKQEDWGSNVEVVGTIELPEAAAMADFDSANRVPELHEFLLAGSKPIFIGFGSMVITNANEVREKFISAAREAGVRIILQSGWTDLWDSSIPKCSTSEIFCFIGPVPHSWLFQQVLAVVHHGGAGTTAAGLLASKPTMVVPFFGDQYLWGMVTFQKQVGVKPKSLRHLTVEKITNNFRDLKSEEMQMAAYEISLEMKHENGVEDAISALFEKFS